MANHPIEGLMDTAMSNIKSMIDVNTVVGTPVSTPDGTLIIPVSTVSFGFGAGGSEFEGKGKTAPISNDGQAMFGGGCGGGANVKPIAFLVVGNGTIKLLPVTPETSPVNKIIDMVPEAIEKVNCVISDFAQKREEKKKENEPENKDGTVDVM